MFLHLSDCFEEVLPTVESLAILEKDFHVEIPQSQAHVDMHLWLLSGRTSE